MTAAAEVQALLRFLTKDARLPLPEAMSKINTLRKLGLNDAEKIAKAEVADLKVVFTDDKVLKQVTNAAKRATNPRRQQSGQNQSSLSLPDPSQAENPEVALTMPETELDEAQLADVVIQTNRAPLFLAFTLMVLKYTHPEQPLSSRLSLAQAVVSAGAQKRAKYLGITTGPTAEEDGWAQGQPKLRVMGREVAVMRRQIPSASDKDDNQGTTKQEDEPGSSHNAFWGIDLESLRKSNGPLIAGKHVKGQSGPPIHQPQGARNYLLKSMVVLKSSIQNDDSKPQHKSSKAKKVNAGGVAAREYAAAMVLKALDIVYASWEKNLTSDELDRRAQSWYIAVRPDVADGQAGWGQRGEVPLGNILKLKRDA